MIYIIRGISGAGKSTLALSLCPKQNIFEADHYFLKNGKYEFDASKLKDAHDNCFSRFSEAVEQKRTPIAVSNTFTQNWEFERYLKAAKLAGYQVTILAVQKAHENENIHGVPEFAVNKMIERFEFNPII